MSACESKLASRSSRKSQWPRPCFLSRPRSMLSLAGDRGQVLRVLGWALTRITIYRWCYSLTAKVADWRLCVEQSCELLAT